MVRRVAQEETFHGTAAGQAPNVVALAETFGLSERQAQCMALLRMGSSAPAIADVLSISPSTLETHLADLRRKFGCATTPKLVAHLRDLIAEEELDAFHCWPSQTNAPLDGTALPAEIGDRLRRATSLDQALGVLQDALAPVGPRHLYYCFLPHSVQGFLRGDIVDAFRAPSQIERAFHANGGLMGQPIALSLFDAPTSVPVMPLDGVAQPKGLAAFCDACRADGASHLMALGFPAGPGFVGMAITFAPHGDAIELVQRGADRIRATAMALHASVLTNGTLAARFRLTIRERDALSALALGKRANEAAAQMKISERAFSKLLASARSKLNARTNAEAVGKAAIVNALVFL